MPENPFQGVAPGPELVNENPFKSPVGVSEEAARKRGSRRSSLTIKYIHPLQAGKLLGILYFLLGLIIAPFVLIGAFVAPDPETAGASIGVAIGMLFGYAICGLIGGVVAAAIYSLVAHLVGGLRFDTE